MRKTFVQVATLLLLSCSLLAQTPVLMPLPRQCFNDNLSTGKPLAGGFLFTCVAGTSCPGNPLATFTDATGLTLNQNPITLDLAGCASIWLSPSQNYKIVAQNSSGVQEWTADQVSGLAASFNTTLAATTTVAFSATPTFTSLAQTQLFKMTLSSNVTSSALLMTGLTAPAIVSFEITQNATGGFAFSFPPSTFGAAAICGAANCTTTETFLWDGTTALLLNAWFNNAGVATQAASNLQIGGTISGANTFPNLQTFQGGIGVTGGATVDTIVAPVVNGVTATGNNNGGNILLTAGTGAGSGNGGNIVLNAGTGGGTGVGGTIQLNANGLYETLLKGNSGYKRLYASQGTAQVGGNVSPTGWGTSPTIVIRGTDAAFSLSITAGTGPSANPTAAVTWADGNWGAASPAPVICSASRTDQASPAGAYWVAIPSTSPGTTVSVQLIGTPVATATYGATVFCVGIQGGNF